MESEVSSRVYLSPKNALLTFSKATFATERLNVSSIASLSNVSVPLLTIEHTDTLTDLASREKSALNCAGLPFGYRSMAFGLALSVWTFILIPEIFSQLHLTRMNVSFFTV